MTENEFFESDLENSKVENSVIADKIILGDEVVIKTNSKIYKTSYLNNSDEKGYNCYFPYDNVRTISGVTYKIGDAQKTVFLDDENSKLSIEYLEYLGAELVAVCISNENGVEGYLSIDAIEKNTIEKGLSDEIRNR